jgi:hypothetical protein
MGLIQGHRLSSKITGAYRSLRNVEAFRLEQPSWLPYPLFLRLTERKCERSFTPVLRQSNPAMLARMQGIAEGAGLLLRNLCLMNALEAFLGSLEGKTVVPPLGACSAVAIRGKRSRNGAPMVAKNFDYLQLLMPFYILRETRPHGGFCSLDFAVAPQPGTIDGVNEKGLAITLNYAFVADRGHPDPLITMLIADALASCANVSEAIRHLTRTPHWGAGILMLADGSGDLAAWNSRTPEPRCAAQRPVPIGCSSPMSVIVPRRLRCKCRQRLFILIKHPCRCGAAQSCGPTRIVPDVLRV